MRNDYAVVITLTKSADVAWNALVPARSEALMDAYRRSRWRRSRLQPRIITGEGYLFFVSVLKAESLKDALRRGCDRALEAGEQAGVTHVYAGWALDRRRQRQKSLKRKGRGGPGPDLGGDRSPLSPTPPPGSLVKRRSFEE